MTIINITHQPGRHCASTGISDLIRFHGFHLSEAMCFGIGEGLGIWYLSPSRTTPSRMLHVRTANLEEKFFKRIGYPFSWTQFNEPEKSENHLCATLEKGIPALLRTDIYDLPYYNTNTHFPGHLIVVWNYDKNKRVFYVTDTEREEVQAVPFHNMQKARFFKGVFIRLQGDVFAPEQISVPDRLPDLIKTAIIVNSREMLNPSMDYAGLNALQKMKMEMPDWGKLDDCKWTARFIYQIIEKRGTGGSGFRLMYYDFLKEAAEFLPEISQIGLDQRMREASFAWRDFAITLKDASEENSPVFSESIKKLNAIIAIETAYHKEVLNLI
ncbi:MAG: BtrH N-terminal domain-containing protein [Desulfobacterales bacterium]